MFACQENVKANLHWTIWYSFTPENSKYKHSFTSRIWVNFKKIFNSQLFIELLNSFNSILEYMGLNIFIWVNNLRKVNNKNNEKTNTNDVARNNSDTNELVTIIIMIWDFISKNFHNNAKVLVYPKKKNYFCWFLTKYLKNIENENE